MNETNLTEQEIRNLISLYHSELRKLYYQFEKTQHTIGELETILDKAIVSSQIPQSLYEATTETPKKRGPGRPPKAKRGPGRPPKAKRGPGRPPKAKRGPGRPPKAKRGPGRPPKVKRGPGRPPKTNNSGKRTRNVEGGYKLSDWDKYVIDTIQKSDTPLINKEILDEAKKSYPDKSESNLSGRISRTIHKLSNKRDVLIKHKFQGRGNSYSVNPQAEWE